MADDRGPRWFEPYAWAFGGGFLVGLLYALVTRPRDEVILMDTWGYVPKDQPWTHGAVVGSSIVAAYGAMVVGRRLVHVLLRHGLLFTVVGTFLTIAGVFLLSRAVVGDDDVAGKVVWLVLGLGVGALGVPMVMAGRRARPR